MSARNAKRVCVVLCDVIFHWVRASERIQRFTFRGHANKRIVCEPFWRDMPGDAHYRLVAGLGFRKLGDSVMPEVVESQSCKGALTAANIGIAFFLRQTSPGFCNSPQAGIE
jgi:hypothetical protein